MPSLIKKIIVLSIALLSGLNYSFSQSIDTTRYELSPNHDGKNDTYSFHTVNMKKVAIEVKDAGGNVVYESGSLDGTWNGNDLKGNPCVNGLYTYIANCVGFDENSYSTKGTIMLRR